MRLSIIAIAVLSALFYAHAEPQYHGYHDYGYAPQNYFRAGYPHSSFAEERQQVMADARNFFSTVTITIATTTSTSTTTVSTTCTTSTSTLKSCSPSGRRRRGVALNGNKAGRGIFYNEEDHEQEDGSIFLPLK